MKSKDPALHDAVAASYREDHAFVYLSYRRILSSHDMATTWPSLETLSE